MKNWNNHLLISARSGDLKAFERLIEPYEKKIYGMFLSTLHTSSEASSLAQEVFLSVFRSLDAVEKPQDISAVIYKSAKEIYCDLKVESRNVI